MTTNRRSAGGPARGAPVPRSWARSPGLPLLALALIGLAQAGCRSDGCRTCGGFGSNLTNGVQSLGARIFNHGNKGCSTCGGGEEGAIVDPGIPVVAPGGMVVPPPGTIVPAPSIDSSPSQLEPIPSNAGGTSQPSGSSGGAAGSNPASTRSSPGTNRSAYEAYLPRNGVARRRVPDVARAIHSTPEPARPAYAGGDGPPASDPNDLFEHIPPVDVPTEASRKVTTLPTPTPTPAPATIPAQATAPAAGAPAGTSAPENSAKAAPTPAETVSAAEGASPPSPGRHAPGFRRCVSVAPAVGAGSAPSTEGLDWLRERGYKTFLDLRPISEIDPTFVDAVNDRGMFYLSLPIVANRLDASRLARFDDLISRTENRPLFFCDSDGTRAALVWYIHLRAVEGNDPATAAAKAEELGLTGVETKLAEAFLAAQQPRAKVTLAQTPAATPPPNPAASAAAPPAVPEPKQVAAPAPTPTPAPAPTPPPALPSAEPGPSPPPAPVLAPSPSDAPTPGMLPGEHRPQASAPRLPDLYRDPRSWRPIAALILTGVGVPLAYWSKSALSVARATRRRASLPGPARRSLGAPDGSDA